MRSDAELLHGIRLILVATAKSARKASAIFRVDQVTFAEVAETLADTNEIASRFVVSKNLKAKLCPDFASGLSLAILKGLIRGVSSSDGMEFQITMPREEMVSYTRDPLFDEAVVFVGEYERVRGAP
ncbi:MAG: hypothetical protein WCJ29_03030 [bacterium]